jgi:pimeloyl-ACP methyl ester carboxylesterase
LHGYLADKNSFAYQTGYFSKYFSVHAIDLKGFGLNTGMEYPYSLSDYASEVKDYISKNGLIRPHLVAHSFGARIAVKLASENPNLFDKIVITGGAGLKPKRSIKYRFRRLMFKIAKLLRITKNLDRFYSKDYLKLDTVMRQSFVKIVNEHLDDRLKLIKNQTLLIYGAQDKETPLYMAKRFNRGIENSVLTVYKNAGHFPFIDCPYKFNTEVREFLLSK